MKKDKLTEKEIISKHMSKMGKLSIEKYPRTKKQLSKWGKKGAAVRWKRLSTEKDLHTDLP